MGVNGGEKRSLGLRRMHTFYIGLYVHAVESLSEFPSTGLQLATSTSTNRLIIAVTITRTCVARDFKRAVLGAEKQIYHCRSISLRCATGLLCVQ